MSNLKHTSQDENVIIHNMEWMERIIWIIGIATFFGLAIYSSLENGKQKLVIYNQSWEIRDLKFDKMMLQKDVKFYKNMDSLNNVYYLKLFNTLLRK
jgi:hypothetical protein